MSASTTNLIRIALLEIGDRKRRRTQNHAVLSPPPYHPLKSLTHAACHATCHATCYATGLL